MNRFASIFAGILAVFPICVGYAQGIEVAASAAPVGSESAPTETTTRPKYDLHPYLSASTEFPFFTGGDAGLRAFKHWDLSFGYGFMPTAYAGFIGSRIDQFANKSGYDSLVKGLMNSNRALRGSFKYHFRGRKGWALGASYMQFSSDGTNSITDVETLTGVSFTGLKTILNATGKELIFNSSLELGLLTVMTSYTFGLFNRFYLETSFGVSKVIANRVELSSNAPNFDASNAGQTAYTQAKEELDSVLKKYGYSPLLGLGIVYEF